ncbi:hypothetical protein [Aeromonas caviae]|uniref:hypothetical protein n=1 Tax=Aeromonas caviae TaxID=648 RepID=UPI0011AEB2C0|nr:hypothetical protein [Aeromonas caviae]MBS4637733.1 hypothetical protein [Aeromonas caviae]WQD90367.1 hypothetical protein U0022_06585 [Aeromonas caviae]
MDYATCSVSCTDSKVVVQENQSRFEVINKSKLKITKVQVDGCLINDDREKCDWIIEVEKSKEDKHALFIELKGCNLDKAISQLQSTLNDTKDRYKSHHKECYAVTSRVPKHGATVRKRNLEFHKKNNVVLFVKNLRASIQIEN